MIKANTQFRIACVSIGILMAAYGCQKPPAAGSLDPHGPYTVEEARAAGAAHFKHMASQKPPGASADHSKPAGPTTPNGN